MNQLKKICKILLFPHIVIRFLLIPISTIFLMYSMLYLHSQSKVAIISYLIAFYTLTIWCVKIPNMITFIKCVKNQNKYAVILTNDVRLRVNLSLYSSFLWNVAYATLQLWLGFQNHSFWFCSMAGYYISLAFMRFFLVRHTRKYKPGENMYVELLKYRTCGWIFLIMNLAISLMIFFMVYWNRTFEHNEIITIAMAAYTFTAFTTAIINIIKYRKYNSPVFSASKAISMAAASVSMLTLTSTMLTTFGEADGIAFRRLMLGLLGGTISVFIISMAIYMIVRANKALHRIKQENK